MENVFNEVESIDIEIGRSFREIVQLLSTNNDTKMIFNKAVAYVHNWPEEDEDTIAYSNDIIDTARSLIDKRAQAYELALDKIKEAAKK